MEKFYKEILAIYGIEDICERQLLAEELKKEIQKMESQLKEYEG